MKEHLGILPLEFLHSYSTLKQKGSKGVLRGPTEHFIQVAMHVRQIKCCKWPPVIIPIKEQLRVGAVVSMAAVLCLLPLFNIQLNKRQASSV